MFWRIIRKHQKKVKDEKLPKLIGFRDLILSRRVSARLQLPPLSPRGAHERFDEDLVDRLPFNAKVVRRLTLRIKESALERLIADGKLPPVEPMGLLRHR
jgi:hypothetical protein